MLNETNVSVIHEPDAIYPTEPPFHPSGPDSKYPFKEWSNQPNFVYATVRNFFRLHGFDSEDFLQRQFEFVDDIRPASSGRYRYTISNVASF